MGQTIMRIWIVVGAVLLAACGGGDTAAPGDYSTRPPTTGQRTAGPGSGEDLAGHVGYTYQKSQPGKKVETVTCDDAPENPKPGTEVPCEVTVQGEGSRKVAVIFGAGGDLQLQVGGD